MTIHQTNVRLVASAGSWIESAAVDQLCAAAQLEGVRSAVGFPDLHPGKGGPVGAAILTEGRLYPHLIGGDIGCGMALFRTDLLRHKARPERWAQQDFRLEKPWEGDVRSWLRRSGLHTTDFDDAHGTVGGGNHFAEVQAVEKVYDAAVLGRAGLNPNCLILLVHSGSRGLGERMFRAYAAEHGAKGVLADSEAGEDYLRGHDFAVRWGESSRRLLAARLAAELGAGLEQVWDGCHNRISTVGAGLWLHRKGAAPSDGEWVAIPGSRGTLTYLVRPLVHRESNAWSLAHGAGRKWSRSASRQRVRERFKVGELVQTPLGGRVICEQRDLLYEEAPTAYKNIDEVVEALVTAGLVSIIATLRPLLTYKTRAV